MQASDLSLLVALDALLQESSVTRAARRLGLSTPAMSHTLARIRERIGDPVLVRAGREMCLTPRAEALKPRVRSVVEEAQQVLAEPGPFSPAELSRSFTVLATDYVLTVLGRAIDREISAAAPAATLRFAPNTPGDGDALREGAADLAVGIYGDLPPELRTRRLLTDRFVCAVRAGHPLARRRVTLEQYVSARHLQIAPRGAPGGYVDDELAARGLERHVARAVPFFSAALELVATTDYVLTVSERIARAAAASLGLHLFEVPLDLDPYALSLVWHPRFDGDPAHAFVRDAFVRAAAEVAGDAHAAPRARLDPPRRARGRRG